MQVNLCARKYIQSQAHEKEKYTQKNMNTTITSPPPHKQQQMMMDCADIATLLYTVPPHILNAVKLDTDPIGNSTYDGSFNQVWGGEDIAAPGTQPTMLAAYSQSDRGSILPLDRTALKHWVEVEGVHIGGPRGPPGAQTSRGPSEPGTPPPEFEFEEGNTTPRSGVTPGGSFTMQGVGGLWVGGWVVFGVHIASMYNRTLANPHAVKTHTRSQIRIHTLSKALTRSQNTHTLSNPHTLTHPHSPDNEKWSSDEDDAAPRSGTTSRMSKAPSPRERGGDGETGDSSEDDDAPAQPKFRITIKVRVRVGGVVWVCVYGCVYMYPPPTTHTEQR